MNKRILMCILAALVLCSPALAHDFWIEPSSFHPEALSKIGVSLRVGENFAGEPVKRSAAKIRQFILVDGNGEKTISGSEGADPAGEVTLERPGIYVIGYRSNHSSIELDAAKFEAYLKEEGLEHVIELRKKRGQSEKPAREIYSRCAKTIFTTPSSGEAGELHRKPLGFSLEIIPQNDPTGLKNGEELSVQLLFEGAPLAGAAITFMPKAAPTESIKAVTNTDGIAKAKLDKPGMWMVKTVHIIPAFDASVADWESLWATLTFEIPSKKLD